MSKRALARLKTNLQKFTPVRDDTAKPPWRQILEMTSFSLRRVLTPPEYRMYRMYERGRGSREAMGYLSGFNFRDVYRLLNAEMDPATLDDKQRFHEHYRSRGFPLPTLVAVLDRDDVGAARSVPIARSSHDLERLLRPYEGASLIAKPSMETRGGAGVTHVVICEGTGGEIVLSTDSGIVDLPRFVETVPHRQVTLFEVKALQAESLRELTGEASSIVRIGTFRRADGATEVLYGIFYGGVAEREVINLHRGAVGVRVASVAGTDAGTLTGRGYMESDRGLIPYTHHPITGTEFAGYRLPHWDSAVKLSVQLTDELPGARFIGWDIILGEDGPVVLEGNSFSGPQFAQLDTDGFLTNDFRAELFEIAELELPKDRLPSFDVGSLVRNRFRAISKS